MFSEIPDFSNLTRTKKRKLTVMSLIECLVWDGWKRLQILATSWILIIFHFKLVVQLFCTVLQLQFLHPFPPPPPPPPPWSRCIVGHIFTRKIIWAKRQKFSQKYIRASKTAKEVTPNIRIDHKNFNIWGATRDGYITSGVSSILLSMLNCNHEEMDTRIAVTDIMLNQEIWDSFCGLGSFIL